MSRSEPAPRKPRASTGVKGSDATTRQIKKSVIEGRLIHVYPYACPDNRIVSGYVSGMDDFHWVIADTGRQKVVLVHKAAVFVVLDENATLDEIITSPTSDSSRWLVSVVTPFRNWCSREWVGTSLTEDVA